MTELSLHSKLQMIRARAVAYDEGYRAFCKTREDERVCPYIGNLKQPWQDGWDAAEREYGIALIDISSA